LKVRRTKPYVCIDVDFAEHFRFQKSADLDATTGTWLRCMAHSRAQELDGVVPAGWVKRTFVDHMDRIEDLISVGLLLLRDDGDYELRAYAPRNQTRAMMATQRKATRKRVRKWRKEAAKLDSVSKGPNQDTDVTVVKRVTEPGVTLAVTPDERGSNAPVPTSNSTSILRSIKSFSSSALDPLTVVSVPRASADADARAERRPLSASERSLSGSFWLAAFDEGITAHTGRPCTTGRMYVSTLERLVTHHAPDRNTAKACAWLRDQSQAFAAKWDGHHPPKGLTPDGLERWLNEGQSAPPSFGKPRIVQPAAEDWHEDDWSDLGARVDR
jgi:hypothetical protein